MDHLNLEETIEEETIPSSSSLNTNQSCIICSKQHNYEDCDYVKITTHVPDSEIPSRAKLSIPDFLQLQILSDGSYSIVTNSFIQKGTQFGPLQAEKVQTLDPTSTFPLKVFSSQKHGDSDYYLDVSDENKCSWLIFVDTAEHLEEQNLICYQKDDGIYYIAIKDIDIGSALKVWYAPYYAQKMNKTVLKPKSEIDPLKNIDINSLIKTQQKVMERKTWTCKFCSQMEDNIVSFASHMLKHYTAQLKKMCEICKKCFGTKKSLKSHLKIVHRSSFGLVAAKPLKKLDTVPETQCKDVALGGPLLNNIFTDSSDLQQADLNLDLNLDNQNLLLDSDNLSVDNLLSEKDLDHFNFDIDDNQNHFVCDICLKQFTKVKLLVIHLRHHTGEFTCHKCLKIFCRKENFKSHICNVDSCHNCTLCDKTFTQRKYLSRHLEAYHNKKFSCSKCNKFYYSNKELVEHNCSNVPSVEKEKFACLICDKNFFREAYLRKHLRTHSQRSEQMKKFIAVVCETCGLNFESRNSYYLHRKTHKEALHRCDSCGKRFNRLDSLKHHQLIHNKNLEIVCNICKKKFKTKKILTNHKRSHENEKPHKCPVCDLGFKQRTNLTRHLKTVHPENECPEIVYNYYSCPVCNKSIKLRSSLLRHLKKVHADVPNVDVTGIEPKQYTSKPPTKKFKPKNRSRNEAGKNKEVLTATELDDQINNLLNSAENNSAIQKTAVDKLVKELDMGTSKEVDEEEREVCLSIPDLTEADQEITLDTNAYILENGTIVQPQGNTDNVIIYVLDQTF